MISATRITLIGRADRGRLAPFAAKPGLTAGAHACPCAISRPTARWDAYGPSGRWRRDSFARESADLRLLSQVFHHLESARLVVMGVALLRIQKGGPASDGNEGV